MHRRVWRTAYFQDAEPDIVEGEEREMAKMRLSVSSLGLLHSENLDLDLSSPFRFLLRPGLWPLAPASGTQRGSFLNSPLYFKIICSHN